jgi:glucose-6-phosphate 1-dehydrogenase
MVQNVMAIRFANVTLEPIWNRQYIASVLIDYQETFGSEVRKLAEISLKSLGSWRLF